jgi:hypothetical protein
MKKICGNDINVVKNIFMQTRKRRARGVQPTPEQSEAKDTPKRRKTQTTFYQSPILTMNPVKSNGSTSSKSTPADRSQLFKKGKFLAVRNADGMVYFSYNMIIYSLITLQF